MNCLHAQDDAFDHRAFIRHRHGLGHPGPLVSFIDRRFQVDLRGNWCRVAGGLSVDAEPSRVTAFSIAVAR